MLFKDIVLDEMQKQGITPLELSRIIDRPRTTVNNFLGPNSKSPSMELGGPIAKALQISLDALYDIKAPGMSDHELHRIQVEHEALVEKYKQSQESERLAREREEREILNALETGRHIEQLETENGHLKEELKKRADQITFLSYVESKSMDRIRWQKIIILVLILLCLFFAFSYLAMDAAIPSSGLIRY